MTSSSEKAADFGTSDDTTRQTMPGQRVDDIKIKIFEKLHRMENPVFEPNDPERAGVCLALASMVVTVTASGGAVKHASVAEDNSTRFDAAPEHVFGQPAKDLFDGENPQDILNEAFASGDYPQAQKIALGQYRLLHGVQAAFFLVNINDEESFFADRDLEFKANQWSEEIMDLIQENLRMNDAFADAFAFDGMLESWNFIGSNWFTLLHVYRLLSRGCIVDNSNVRFLEKPPIVNTIPITDESINSLFKELAESVALENCR